MDEFEVTTCTKQSLASSDFPLKVGSMVNVGSMVKVGQCKIARVADDYWQHKCFSSNTRLVV